jgi:hypothetical protein
MATTCVPPISLAAAVMGSRIDVVGTEHGSDHAVLDQYGSARTTVVVASNSEFRRWCCTISVPYPSTVSAIRSPIPTAPSTCWNPCPATSLLANSIGPTGSPTTGPYRTIPPRSKLLAYAPPVHSSLNQSLST